MIKERDLLDKLFGTPDEMADEDLDTLYKVLAADTNPGTIVHRLAEEAAVEYRTQNRIPPDHVQAALDATREVKSLDKKGTQKLMVKINAEFDNLENAKKFCKQLEEQIEEQISEILADYKQRISAFDVEYDDGKWWYRITLADGWYLPDEDWLISEDTLSEVRDKLATAHDCGISL